MGVKRVPERWKWNVLLVLLQRYSHAQLKFSCSCSLPPQSNFTRKKIALCFLYNYGSFTFTRYITNFKDRLCNPAFHCCSCWRVVWYYFCKKTPMYSLNMTISVLIDEVRAPQNSAFYSLYLLHRSYFWNHPIALKKIQNHRHTAKSCKLIYRADIRKFGKLVKSVILVSSINVFLA